MKWDPHTKENFELMIANVPVFMRELVHSQISKQAEEFAKNKNQESITEKDMVDAFFKITPFGFHGPMKTDMNKLNIDYHQYGHD